MLATLRCLALLLVLSPISFHPHNSGRNLLLSHLIGWETEAEQVNLFTVISLCETEARSLYTTREHHRQFTGAEGRKLASQHRRVAVLGSTAGNRE